MNQLLGAINQMTGGALGNLGGQGGFGQGHGGGCGCGGGGPFGFAGNNILF
ncbi:MAG: hypothetical protein AB7S38_28180 [Vulcanimicrobiota bacterium]